jgi:hypothetical protein
VLAVLGQTRKGSACPFLALPLHPPPNSHLARCGAAAQPVHNVPHEGCQEHGACGGQVGVGQAARHALGVGGEGTHAQRQHRVRLVACRQRGEAKQEGFRLE